MPKRTSDWLFLTSAEPLRIASFAPAMGPAAGGTEVHFTIASNLLIYSSATAERLQPACKFGIITVPGTFHQPSSSADPNPYISCPSPTSRPGFVRLAVSLNGQEWAPVTGSYHSVWMLDGQDDPGLPGGCFYGQGSYEDCGEDPTGESVLTYKCTVYARRQCLLLKYYQLQVLSCSRGLVMHHALKQQRGEFSFCGCLHQILTRLTRWLQALTALDICILESVSFDEASSNS